jgi:hypothetical protein
MTNDQETQKRYDHRFWQLSVLRLIAAQQCLSLYMTASHELYDKSYFALEENEKHALEEEVNELLRLHYHETEDFFGHPETFWQPPKNKQ